MSIHSDKKGAERRIFRRATNYSIHQIINDLETLGTSNNLIGLVFSENALQNKRQEWLSYFTGASETVQRDIMKNFQESSRFAFYNLLQNLSIGKKTPKSLHDIYQREIEMLKQKSRYSDGVWVSENSGLELHLLPRSMEGVASHLVLEPELEDVDFEEIGKAVKIGSRRYFSGMKRSGHNHFYRHNLFLEYRRTLDELSKIEM